MHKLRNVIIVFFLCVFSATAFADKPYSEYEEVLTENEEIGEELNNIIEKTKQLAEELAAVLVEQYRLQFLTEHFETLNQLLSSIPNNSSVIDEKLKKVIEGQAAWIGNFRHAITTHIPDWTSIDPQSSYEAAADKIEEADKKIAAFENLTIEDSKLYADEEELLSIIQNEFYAIANLLGQLSFILSTSQAKEYLDISDESENFDRLDEVLNGYLTLLTRQYQVVKKQKFARHFSKSRVTQVWRAMLRKKMHSIAETMGEGIIEDYLHALNDAPFYFRIKSNIENSVYEIRDLIFITPKIARVKVMILSQLLTDYKTNLDLMPITESMRENIGDTLINGYGFSYYNPCLSVTSPKPLPGRICLKFS